MLNYVCTAIQILRKLTKACTSYSNFSKWCEKKKIEDEENYEESKTNFEGTYLSDSLVDSSQI